MNPRIIGALCTILFFVALASTTLAGPSDTEAAFDTEAALRDLNESMPGSEHRERVAARICREAKGPGSQVLWTVDEDLVCRAAAEGGAQ